MIVSDDLHACPAFAEGIYLRFHMLNNQRSWRDNADQCTQIILCYRTLMVPTRRGCYLN